MCEWLSCADWCDVRLQCGGAARELQAHRAVLASVSAFLRRILLSCPTDETPTFILLPDFDLETMSSVLYYIYNGEVVIQKNKIETFMEIARVMQIFVDGRYLPESCKSAEDSILLGHENDKSSHANKIFCLGDGPFVKLQKSDKICYGQSNQCEDWDARDKQTGNENKFIECEDWTKRQCFENVQPIYGDRQRSFLRDLYIETYPRNGNANGRLAGVPAIPSKSYRPPPSHLPTNANDTHLNNDTHVEMLKKTNILLSNNVTSQLCIQNSKTVIDETMIHYAQLAKYRNAKESSSILSVEPNSNYCNTSKDISHWNIALKYSQMLPQACQDFGDKSFLPCSESGTHNNSVNSPFSRRIIQRNKLLGKKMVNSTVSKGAILNHVLQSPWCPRQPISYRPIRREKGHLTDFIPTNTKDKVSNDDNNNVQTSLNGEENEKMCASTILENANAVPITLNSADFKCTICDQVFTDSQTLSIHTRRHTASAKYSCTECSKSFSQLRNFKYHMSIHRGTREFAATCTVCGKYFNDRGYLSSHMKIHRNRKEYKCSQCPKSFNQRVAYNMHVRIHTGVKPHVCGECGKAFSRKMLLKQHLRTHSGERPYACPHCDKRFADRSNMTLHLRLHTGIKPFSCTMCPKSFTKKHHLKSHLNFHTGAKPYSCPKCKLAFTQSSNMRTHFKKCTAPDPNENANTSAGP